MKPVKAADQAIEEPELVLGKAIIYVACVCVWGGHVKSKVPI